jgi:hypothetical protein
VDFCSEREHGRSFALVRIALGVVLTAALFLMLLSGPIDPLFVSVADGGLARARHLHPLLPDSPTPGLIHAMFAAALLSSITLTAGLFGRIGGRLNAFVLLQLLLALSSVTSGVNGAYDALFHNALWLLVLGDGSATLSIACLRRTGSWTSDLSVPAFARSLAVFQLVLLYSGAGIAKHSQGWFFPYEALYYSLRRVTYARLEAPWLGDVFFFTQIGTAVSWWFECTFWVVGVWFLARRGLLGERAKRWTRFDLRLPYVAAGLGMHFMIFVTMDVGPFSAVTLVYYFALLESDDRLPRFLRRRSPD